VRRRCLIAIGDADVRRSGRETVVPALCYPACRILGPEADTGEEDAMPLVLPERDPCPYCENFAGRYAWHGPPAVVAEDETIFVFLAPAALGGMAGHTLVTTRRHVATIFDLTPDEEAALGRAVARAARAIRAAFDPDGVLVQ
jgi:hypothetical protein